MAKIAWRTFLVLVVASMIVGCSSYRQNIMFKATSSTPFSEAVLKTEKNYVIQKNDYLKLEVFSNKGERIIDPDAELSKQMGNAVQASAKPQLTYLVNQDGVAKFPMIGDVKLEDLTLYQAEAVLQKLYDQFYKDCFVALTFANKRVIILGSMGGQVIPLTNQNVRLAEVLAMAKGLANDAKAKNIRLIRNDQTYLADLSTIDGYRKTNMIVEPGDIIYVEPVRRPFVEGLRDYAPFASLIVSLASLAVVLSNQFNNSTP